MIKRVEHGVEPHFLAYGIIGSCGHEYNLAQVKVYIAKYLQDGVSNTVLMTYISTNIGQCLAKKYFFSGGYERMSIPIRKICRPSSILIKGTLASGTWLVVKEFFHQVNLISDLGFEGFLTWDTKGQAACQSP